MHPNTLSIALSPEGTLSNDISTPSPALYLFHGHKCRVILTDNGELRWVAADVASILGLGRTHDMVRALDDDEKGADTIRTPSGHQTMTIVTESGLYSCILRSRKPEAREFKRWVTHEVIPELRRTGTYAMQSAGKDDEVIRQALLILDRRVGALQAANTELQPKADAYSAFMEADGALGMNAVAKMLGIGQNQLFQTLRRHRVLITGGDRHNLPYQRHAAHFKVVANEFVKPNGVRSCSYTTHVKPSGLDFIRHIVAKDPQSSAEFA